MKAASADPAPLVADAGAPRRILMTTDAIGGVWHYAIDVGKSLGQRGIEVVLAVVGPAPTDMQQHEASRITGLRLVQVREPLDWLAEREQDLDQLPASLSRLAADYGADLIHLNLPSQAYGLEAPCPVVVVSHSCVVSWWRTVKGGDLPDGWRWQKRRNRAGFDAADLVLSPSRSHAAMLRTCYGRIEGLKVVYNGTGAGPAPAPKEPFVLAAGRWWDEGKNAKVLDEAAQRSVWPVLMAGSCVGPQGQATELRHAKHLGERSNLEIRTMMARAAIVVSPSLYEPFGLVALEAARAEAALVLADIPTYRELWGGAAIFADPRDPQEFAAAINRLAADERLRVRLARAAARRAENYSLEAQATGLIQAYRSAGATGISANKMALAG